MTGSAPAAPAKMGERAGQCFASFFHDLSSTSELSDHIQRKLSTVETLKVRPDAGVEHLQGSPYRLVHIQIPVGP